MKFLILVIILFSLYLIYRLSFPGQAENRRGDKPKLPEAMNEDEAVLKNRFVFDFQRQPLPTPATPENSDKQDKNTPIFAAGNAEWNVIIPMEELPEIFGEDINPDDLDIEPDANETDSDDEPDADEETEEIRQSAGGIEGYAEGFTYDELATAIHDADKQEAMAKVSLETLRDLAQTDMFEQLVSGDAGRAARIAAVLDHSEQSLASRDEDAAEEDKDNEYQNFDITQFLS
jgi:hypothetical protein